MKGKATITKTAPNSLFGAFGSGSDFARTFVTDVIEQVFGAKLARFRSAEYYLQQPDEMAEIEHDFYGVIFSVSGISRTDEREPKVFHEAMKKTVALCVRTIQGVLDDGQWVQLFVNMMLTGDVPVLPPGKGYTPVLESKPVWVSKRVVSEEMPVALTALIEKRVPEDSTALSHFQQER